MSALLTTTMPYMKTVIDGYKERGMTQKFDIGGASINQMFADDFIAQWKWREEQEHAGSPQEVAEAVRKELESAR